MDELQNSSPEENEQLIAELANLNEELQTENEQQREELRKLHRQLQTSSSDNQRLSAELQAAIQNTKKLKAENEDLRMKLHRAEQTSSQTQQQSSELRTALSKIQTLTEKLSEQQRQTQTLLSDNQKLRSQVQQLTAKNESLQSSDEQLRHAEELKKQSERQEKQAKERERQANISIDKAQREANAAIAAAKKKEAEAQTAKNAAEQTKRQQKSLIQEKAEELQDQFRNKWAAAAAVLLTYSLLATVLTAFKSERCVSDITAAGQLIGKVVMGIINVIYTLATGAGSVGAHIQQPVVSTIVTYLLGIIVAALCMAAIGAGLFFVGKALVNCYTEHCWDEISPLVALVSLAVLVWGAELMPLNIVLLLILSHAVYIVVRWYIDGYKEARGLR